jgi:hypothetical protein
MFPSTKNTPAHFSKLVVQFLLTCGILNIFLLVGFGETMPTGVLKNLKYRADTRGFMFTRLQEAERARNIDILILGSSHAYRGFDTRNFKAAGYSAFNLGSRAQSPIQTKILLNRYLDSLNPKTIIYEVYPWTFEIDGVESSLDIISSGRNDFESVRMALELNNVKTYNTLVFGMYKDLLGLSSGFSEPMTLDDDTYIPGGYVQKELKYFRHTELPPENWVWNSAQLLSFEENIALIRRKKIRLVLVQAPVTAALYRSYTNVGEFNAMMKSHGEYYDFNAAVTLDDSLHFMDSDHLNQDGVNIFNNAVIEALRKPSGK